MHTTPVNIDLLLPYGEALRGFMEQPYIASADLKSSLRSRGIFLRRNEKRDTIPVLVCCLLSPQEFEDLRQRQENREDNPKTITRTLAWSSNKSVLDALPKELNLAELLFGDSVNYKVVGSPEFVPVGNDHNNVCCEFEIEREDLSKNWAATRNHFKGKLRIEKPGAGSAIRFVLTNTADETKDLNHRFVRRLTQHFKENGDVNGDSEIETIRFLNFDNEGRIAFFRSLTRGVESAGLEFVEVTDCGVCPDGRGALPREVKWMEGHVKGLNINGVALQETVFMSEQYRAYHKLFLFYGMEAKFRFDIPVAKGICSIGFEFPDFALKKDRGIELEANISALSLDSGQSAVNRTAVKEELLRRVNDFKLARFEEHRQCVLEKTREALPDVAPSAVQLELNSSNP